jgi:hypothetical protein
MITTQPTSQLAQAQIPLTYVFYITNEMQLIQRSLLLLSSALHISGGISAHHQELIKLYVQPWVLSCFPAIHRWCGWVGTTHPSS